MSAKIRPLSRQQFAVNVWTCCWMFITRVTGHLSGKMRQNWKYQGNVGDQNFIREKLLPGRKFIVMSEATPLFSKLVLAWCLRLSIFAAHWTPIVYCYYHYISSLEFMGQSALRSQGNVRVSEEPVEWLPLKEHLHRLVLYAVVLV